MQSIQVLSDIPKGGNKLDNSAAPREKTFSARPNNAANAFATLFSGVMNSSENAKGQQNSKAGQNVGNDFEDHPVSSLQDSQNEDSMPGQGNLVFSIFIQPLLQSDLPAGKEANSGNGMGQESMLTLANGSMNPLSSLAAGNNLELALAKLLSLVSDEALAQSGMTEAQAQGVNPGISELDKYKQLIEKLLTELSGNISKGSSEGKNLNLEVLKAGEHSQETAKIVQGWMTAMDENGKLTSLANQKGNNPLQGNSAAGQDGEDQELKTGAEKLVAELNRILSKEAGMNQKLNTQLNAKGEGTASETKMSFGEDLQKAHKSQGTEASSTKSMQEQNITGIGANGNIAVTNIAEGKAVAGPVWEQISNVIREQLLYKQQDLRRLDLQLHPAELGKIQIAMRWENGQLHLQFHVSEAATAQLLQNQLENLRQSLMNQGVDCGMLQMGQSGEQQQDQQGNEPRKTLKHSVDFMEDTGSAVALTFSQDGNNLINVTA